MSKHKNHIPKNDSFLNKVFSKKLSKEAYTDLEWEAKQGLEELGEEETKEALARIHKRIETQKRKQTVIPIWRYAAAAACAVILIIAGNQVINSNNNEGPISYDAQKTQSQDSPPEKGPTSSTEEIQETIADQSMPDQESSIEGDALYNKDLEMDVKDSNTLPAPAEPALVAEDFEEVASEQIIVLDPPNDMEANSSSQGSAVIEEEEKLPYDMMEDDMMVEMSYRSSEKISQSTDIDQVHSVTDSLYDWNSAFSEKKFQQITKRFRKSGWAEQHTNEVSMFFAARAYHALNEVDKAKTIMQEVIQLDKQKAAEAQSFLEQWEE